MLLDWQMFERLELFIPGTGGPRLQGDGDSRERRLGYPSTWDQK